MTPDREQAIDAAIAEYLQACDAGRPPEREAFLAKHPELAAELVPFLNDHLRMKRATKPDDFAETIGFEGKASDSLGTVKYVGDYELLGELARGGMGVVYRARQVSLNRTVAVKMILSGSFASASDLARFRLEAEAAANLAHPNILPIYEVGVHEGRPYFSMKLVTGGSLAERSDLPIRKKCEILVAVCRAVHFAHQHGVLHRDLKPANILLDSDGTPYVTDFGLAKRTDTDDGATRTGAILGTPGYMPPEQARGEKGIRTAADVYSLGAVLYFLLSGRPPFQAETVYETVKQVIEKDPEITTGDRDLVAITLKCLSKNPADRYASAEHLAEDLERFLAGEPTMARPPSVARMAFRWLKQNALTSVFVIVLGAGWGKAMALGTFALMGLDKMVMQLPQDSTPWNPLWWYVEAGRSWYARIPLMIIAMVLTLASGWLVRLAVRPKDMRTAVSASAIVGGLATFVAFLALGTPIIALSSKNDKLRLHPIHSHEDFITDDPAEHEHPYLKKFLPANAHPPGTREYSKELYDTRVRLAGTNRLYAGIITGFGVVLVFALFFLPPAVASGWAADHLVRSGRGFFGCLVGYLELYPPVFLLSVWSCITVCMWYVPQVENVDSSYTLRPFYLLELLGIALVACSITGVVRQWRWWVRLLLYIAWLGAWFSYARFGLD